MNPMQPVSTHRIQWMQTLLKAMLFVFKNRIKAPRVVPAPPTGNPDTDETTRREFERVKEQLNADYQDQRALLVDLEPLLTELAEQLQGWMNQRDELFQSVMLGRHRAVLELPATSASSAPAPAVGALPAAPPGAASAADFLGGNTANAYEGQLVRGDGTDAVFKIENGRKRWIISGEVFTRNGFQWNAVRVIPRQVVDNIPFGNNIG
jgi:hypothetical protein